MKNVYLAAAAVLITSGAVSARAEVLYQTGFEAPDYTAGALDGQDGWGSGNGVSQVETTTVLSGSQALSVNVSTDGAFPSRGVAYDSSANP